MKTHLRHFLVIVFALIFTTLFGQDIFYTLSGEVSEQKVGLDSILFENLQNDTRLLFDNLSDQEDYVINLTTQTLSDATGISDLELENEFSLLSNTNGKLSIGCNYPAKESINVSIYNIQGQRVYASSPIQLINGNSIHIQLAKTGIYLVKIESVLGAKTFKALGSANIDAFDVSLNFQKLSRNTNLKSSFNAYDSDFSFEVGDRISVSVYKDGYWAASNIHQISSSIPINFVFSLSTPFTDTRDGQVYSTIEIGTQTWMAENLKYLPAVVDPGTASYTEPYYYVYGYNGTDVATAKATENYTTYGVLYNWTAAMDSVASSTSNPSGVQGVCPSGWHLPSDEEWKTLEMELGMSQSDADADGWRGTDQGEQMKSTTGWNSNGNGTNSSGFNALPGGFRHYLGSFSSLGSFGSWWSSSEKTSSSSAWYRYLYYYHDQVYRGYFNKASGFSVRCIKDDEIAPTSPDITTSAATSISSSSAIVGGNVLSEGGDEVSDRGVYWSTETDAEISGTKISIGSGLGEFSETLSSLAAAITYYVKAYAINSVSTEYGDEISFTTSPESGTTGTYTDTRDDQTYTTIVIGTQTWFAENLNYETNLFSWFYDNSSANGDIYGRLYNGESAKEACPSGWHLPSDEEWKTLEMELGMSQNEADDTRSRGTDQGGQMKSTTGWYNNGNGTNNSGFNALPGGTHYYDGSSDFLGRYGLWWSSSDDSGTDAWFRNLSYDSDQVFRNSYGKDANGLSVRCLKD